MHDYERDYMVDTHGFQAVCSGMKVKADECKVEDVASFRAFFQASSDMAHIVYCSDEQKVEVEQAAREHFKGLAIAPAIHHNASEKAVLHDNDEKSVHIVTEARLLRGFDYRAPVTGFALLVAKQLGSKRAFRQALGRAGRMGDRGYWAKK